MRTVAPPPRRIIPIVVERSRNPQPEPEPEQPRPPMRPNKILTPVPLPPTVCSSLREVLKSRGAVLLSEQELSAAKALQGQWNSCAETLARFAPPNARHEFQKLQEQLAENISKGQAQPVDAWSLDDLREDFSRRCAAAKQAQRRLTVEGHRIAVAAHGRFQVAARELVTELKAAWAQQCAAFGFSESTRNDLVTALEQLAEAPVPSVPAVCPPAAQLSAFAEL
jgi:hypothetical protein